MSRRYIWIKYYIAILTLTTPGASLPSSSSLALFTPNYLASVAEDGKKGDLATPAILLSSMMGYRGSRRGYVRHTSHDFGILSRVFRLIEDSTTRNTEVVAAATNCSLLQTP